MFVKLKCNVSADGKDYTIDDVVELDGETAEMLIERGDAEAAVPVKPKTKAQLKADADAAALAVAEAEAVEKAKADAEAATQKEVAT
jgi:hypothetical protein